MNSPLHTRRSHEEQTLAVAVILWVMIAGACVVVANAWAMAGVVNLS